MKKEIYFPNFQLWLDYLLSKMTIEELGVYLTWPNRGSTRYRFLDTSPFSVIWKIDDERGY